MSDKHIFSDYFRAPRVLDDGRVGTWYAEYMGILTLREFVEQPDGTALAAPFDMPFAALRDDEEPPDVPDVSRISLYEFENVWERSAQLRLHQLADLESHAMVSGTVFYIRSPFPAELKVNEGASDIYTEYVAGWAHRSFEVWADCVLVAPVNGGVPEVSGYDELRAAYQGIDVDGSPIPPPLRPEEISHRVFEALWEVHALPRLRTIATTLAEARQPHP